MNKQLDVFFIGSGRLAQNLANAIAGSSVKLCGVYSKTISNAKSFSEKFGVPCFENLQSIPLNCSIYFLAVPDSEIEKISSQLITDGLVVHSSGFMPMSQIINQRKAVFWPIQTLSANSYNSLHHVPIGIEAALKTDEELLIQLALLINCTPQLLNGEQRQKLHLAAVLVNNFTNHLYAVAKDFLHKNNLDFNLLLPLIQETVTKIKAFEPALVQTGPAARKDLKTIEEHQKLLKQDPEVLAIYKILTQSIIHHK